MKQELVDELTPLIREASLAAEVRWSRILPAQDIQQELWLKILENSSLEDFFETCDKRRIKKTLVLKANSICSQERFAYAHFSGQFIYSTEDVREILADAREQQTLPTEERVDLEAGLERMLESYPAAHATIEKYVKGLLGNEVTEKRALTRAVKVLTNFMNGNRCDRTDEYENKHGKKNPQKLWD